MAGGRRIFRSKKIPESFQCALPSRPNRMMPCLKSGKGNLNFPPSAAAEKPSREPFSDRHRQTRGHRPAAPPVPKAECLPLYCNPFPVPEKEEIKETVLPNRPPQTSPIPRTREKNPGKFFLFPLAFFRKTWYDNQVMKLRQLHRGIAQLIEQRSPKP